MRKIRSGIDTDENVNGFQFKTSSVKKAWNVVRNKAENSYSDNQEFNLRNRFLRGHRWHGTILYSVDGEIKRPSHWIEEHKCRSSRSHSKCSLWEVTLKALYSPLQTSIFLLSSANLISPASWVIDSAFHWINLPRNCRKGFYKKKKHSKWIYLKIIFNQFQH